jgi:putative ATP-dependent endonuclease of OLD family
VQLKRVTVTNYSRLADLDIEVRGHLVVVGANDVGKTSLLRVLNLVLGTTAQLYQSLGPADLRDREGTLVVETLFGGFRDSERTLFHREIDIDAITGAESLRVRLEVTVDPEDADTVLITRWCPGRGEVRALTREQVAAFGWRYLPAVRHSSAAHFDGASGAIQTLLRAVEPELGEEKATLGGLLESFNTRLESSDALTDLRKGMAQHLSAAMPRTIATDDLAIRTAADPLTSVLDNVSMYLVRDTAFVPLSEQSDGMRELVSMTLFDLAEGTANVIAIDEPELHLHPASQRTVADLLSGAANQKILVTHSPYIVHKFDPTQVVTVRPDGTCHQIDPTRTTVAERVQAHWWSARMLEALTARHAILVEGVADRIVVEAAARARGIHLDRIGAVVFELDGAENFRTVYKLLGPNGFNVDVLGLVDDAEKGPWLGAVGGRPSDVFGHTVFVSQSDLEDEYCRALGPATVAERLITARVARDERALLSSCRASSIGDLPVEGLAAYCRTSKVPSALAVTKGITKEEASTVASVDALLSELVARVGA